MIKTKELIWGIALAALASAICVAIDLLMEEK